MVTTVSESFFNRHLREKVGSPSRQNHWLTVRAANNSEIPYVGYVEVDLEIDGVKVENRGVLVTKNPLNHKRRKILPGLIGTNVLRFHPRYAELFSRECENDPSCGFVRVAEQGTIPPESEMDIRATGKPCGPCAMVEPLATPLPGNLRVGRTLVDTSAPFFVKMMNFSKVPVSIQPKTKIGTVHSVEIESDRVNIAVSKNEIHVEREPVFCSNIVASQGSESSNVTEQELPVGLDLSGLRGNPAELLQAKSLFQRYSSIFARDDNDLGCTDVVRHRISMTDDTPIKQPYRHIPPTQMAEVRDHLEQLLKRGIIRPSTSEYASPIVLVRKKSGALRICVDYRLLNARTRKDAYPLPRIEGAMDALSGSKIFSTMDLQSAYYQVEMEEDDKRKTAFTTPIGLYEFNRMSFDLCNAPATYQRLMHHVVRDQLFQSVLVYLDDVLCYSKSIKGHLERLEEVFMQLQKFGLKLEMSKCEFFQKRVTYLGHQISEDGICADPGKTAAVRGWPVPTTLRELRSFLGFASYYRRFVRDFAKIAAPLHKLTSQCISNENAIHKKSKRKPVILGSSWTVDCNNAYENLKEKLTNPPVLGFADFSAPFILETDASNLGLGAVLSQYQNGQLRVIAYASRGLRGSEKNMDSYSSKKLELLALKWAISEKLRDYLLGANFTVYTDNNPLTYLQTKSKLPAIEQRWNSALASFNFTIKYRPGRHNTNAHALSRLNLSSDRLAAEFAGVLESTQVPSTVIGMIEEEEQINPPEAKVNVMTTFPVLGNSRLAELQQKDPSIAVFFKYRKLNRKPYPEERMKLSREALLLLKQWDRLRIADGILLRRVMDNSLGEILQLVVPDCLRERVLSSLHDQMGHQGPDRTERLARLRVYWPGMHKSIHKWIENCSRCVLAKMPHVPIHTPMKQLVATRPLEVVAIDYTLLEPSTNGLEDVLVLTDVFTKFTVACATRNQTAETVARVLVNEWFLRYGPPQRIHSDRGRNFESEVIAALCKL